MQSSCACIPAVSLIRKTQNSSAVSYTPSQNGLHLNSHIVLLFSSVSQIEARDEA